MEVCKKEKAFITIGSDAHFTTSVGTHDFALNLIEEVNFPHELVINTDVEKFKEFMGRKRKNI